MHSISLVILFSLVATIWAQAVQKNWAINFKSDVEVSNDNFKAVEDWITTNRGTIVDKLNSDDLKVIIAQMDDKIRTTFFKL